MEAPQGPRVGLYVTCLVDLFRPSIGWAAVKLLEDAGCTVEVPPQTCCGQPAYNSGDRALAKELARPVIEAFAPYDYVVVPSGSCAGMLAKHYPALLADDPGFAAEARAFGAKVYELSDFLVTILKVTHIDAEFPHRVTYHDACSGLRELGIAAQPRKLLGSVRGLDLVEMQDHTRCCGFGGTFAVKYGEVSAAIVEEKAEAAEASGAPVLLAGDLGCLMNIAGRLARRGSTIEVRHFAEVLAGMTGTPAICASKT
ncbi:Fe-S oxidoreductase [Methylovirgula ligni]|uniref:L-lactate dehydrogenase complex protein LldE n=1 Tax=Methylovirgula ligni TaxID=569860 RepID=A0A3D9YUN7_9HYPH|nr:(Fe-S)-binding protein [Methylovirgula ligni]QAY96120.1 Fe-S oxidoreductase [Methylovirgula ligni]REF86194.1 L-lactate dehydrogenase complex protein LldE [Methylovirgula ligni]